MGQGSVFCTATRYGQDGPGSNPHRGEIFRTRSDRPKGYPNLPYNGHRGLLPGTKAVGACREQQGTY
jgi:hypothetical protein